MGTPKRVAAPAEPKHPTVSEKEQLFKLAGERRKELNLKPLPLILEAMRGILSPLVPWLDVELPPQLCEPRRGRAMLVLDGSGHRGFPTLMLERSGKWVVKKGFWEDLSIHRMDSDELATLIVKENDSLLGFSANGGGRRVAEEVGFLRDIVLYDSILEMMSECGKTVARALREREERIQIMQEQLGLLRDFRQSLDPLLAAGSGVELKEYSIFSHDSHGSTRYTGGYLSVDDLKPFWDHLGSRATAGSYEQFLSCLHLSSLSRFIEIMAFSAREIAETRSKGEKQPLRLRGTLQDGCHSLTRNARCSRALSMPSAV